MDKKKLAAFAGRLDALEDEIVAARESRGEVLVEAEAAGFSKAALKRLVAYRRKDEAARKEADELDDLVEHYRQALGLTPLEAAIAGSEAA